jgi:drug/metabolite transporter (DMT)-like permease
MVASTSDGPVLLIKKLGGLLAIIFGCLLTAVGATYESSSTMIVGILLLVVGAVLLTLKIVRRNQGSPLG